MFDILPPLSPQQKFIHEDLSSDNSNSLQLVMANKDLLEQLHDCAEAASAPLKIIHQALIHQSAAAFDSDSQYIDAVHHGVTIMEAVSVLVCTEEIFSIDRAKLKLGLFNLAQRMPSEQQDWLVNAHNEFHDSMPQTAEVVQESSSRFLGPLTTYAVIGAAAEWTMLKEAS